MIRLRSRFHWIHASAAGKAPCHLPVVPVERRCSFTTIGTVLPRLLGHDADTSDEHWTFTGEGPEGLRCDRPCQRRHRVHNIVSSESTRRPVVGKSGIKNTAA
jgi:hypothetical protein